MTDLKKKASEVAKAGRFADDVLIHMNAAEVEGLASLMPGGKLPINPKTGLPEAFFFLPFLAGLGAMAAPAAATGAALGTLGTGLAAGTAAAGTAAGLGAAGTAAGLGAAGAAGALGTGATAGLAGTAAGALGTGASALGALGAGGAGVGAGLGAASGAGLGASAAAAPLLAGAAPTLTATGTGAAGAGAASLGAGASAAPAGALASMAAPTAAGTAAAGAGTGAAATASGLGALGKGGLLGTGISGTQALQYGALGSMLLPQLMGGKSKGGGSGKKGKSYDRGEASFPSDGGESGGYEEEYDYYPNARYYNNGGLVGYAEGGLASIQGGAPAKMSSDEDLIDATAQAIMTQDPNADAVIQMFLAEFGPEALQDLVAQIQGSQQAPQGDGMSDSVPAMVGGQEPAAISQGEYIVPADVVSSLGNGDTQAGGTQLQQMVDRTRQMKTGGIVQPPAMDPRTVMPA